MRFAPSRGTIPAPRRDGLFWGGGVEISRQARVLEKLFHRSCEAKRRCKIAQRSWPITPMVYLRGVDHQTHALVANLIAWEQDGPDAAPASLLTATSNLFTAVDKWLIHEVLTVVGGQPSIS